MAVGWKPGLEDIVAVESSICTVDGAAGQLWYRGYDIHDLAEHATFEEVLHLLWEGELPDQDRLAATRNALAGARHLPPEVVAYLRTLPKGAHPLDVLRGAVSLLGILDPDARSNDPDANRRKAVRLVAQAPTLVAAWQRLRNGQEPVAPRSDLGHAANFLYTLCGREPRPLEARTMDISLVLHADHELNASTFAARVTAATLSDLHSAIVTAIGTLKGPLHGGANEDVIEALEKLHSPADAEAWVRSELAAKRRIPGFGHRVYKTLDPRARHLAAMAKQLWEERGDLSRYEIQLKIQEVMRAEKGLEANVDFFSATVYSAMDIPTDLFTSIFAVSRMAGWTAHVREQMENNRLIRPRAHYTGPKGLRYRPLAER